MKKYEFTGEKKGFFRRIRALVDIPEAGVKAGDLGGFITGEHNLSHEGSCWVGGNAFVKDSAKVYDDAQVWGNALVCDNAHVYENAHVYDKAKVYGSARLGGSVRVYGEARVGVSISGYQKVHDNSWVRLLELFGLSTWYLVAGLLPVVLVWAVVVYIGVQLFKWFS